MGIEPTCSAWKADILPLNYTRILSFNRRYYTTTAIWCQYCCQKKVNQHKNSCSLVCVFGVSAFLHTAVSWPKISICGIFCEVPGRNAKNLQKLLTIRSGSVIILTVGAVLSLLVRLRQILSDMLTAVNGAFAHFDMSQTIPLCCLPISVPDWK